MKWYWMLLAVVIGLLCAAICSADVEVRIGDSMPPISEIDMDIIAEIESSGNPMAYNKVSGATGMYQVTVPALEDFKFFNNGWNLSLHDMFDEDYCYLVANWYMNERIPELLEHYGIDDTTDNRLWAYNAGIGHVKQGIMPNETKNYIRKYRRLYERQDS